MLSKGKIVYKYNRNYINKTNKKKTAESLSILICFLFVVCRLSQCEILLESSNHAFTVKLKTNAVSEQEKKKNNVKKFPKQITNNTISSLFDLQTL